LIECCFNAIGTVHVYQLSGMIRNNKNNYIGWQYLATALLGMLQ